MTGKLDMESKEPAGPAPKLHRTAWGWGRTKPAVGEVEAWRFLPWNVIMYGALVLPIALLYGVFGLSFTVWTFALNILLTVLFAIVLFCSIILWHSRHCVIDTPTDLSMIKWRDDTLARKYKGKKVPVLDFYEAYFAEKVDVEGDLLEQLYNRYSFLNFVLGYEHFKFFVFQFIPELLVHSVQQDHDQVREHYDRGNDFYNSFLGPMMIYTSGVFQNENDTLEQAQLNKLELVCNKIHLKKGEYHLDIGCGWGTLVAHAAKNYGTHSLGVTLASEQTKWAMDQIEKAGVSATAKVERMDYRMIPHGPNDRKYDKITCLEMAEHVGVRLFQSFLRQVYTMLKDDGIFFLQIAGLRRAWQYEDFCWGLFMGKYVFPGADASCPLGWVINQCEAAGFEVRSSETIGIHYSATIKRWYDNWKKNRDYIVKKYGEKWHRKWLWFLAWSVISPEEGFASCYQIVLHKNTRAFDRKIFIAERANYKI